MNIESSFKTQTKHIKLIQVLLNRHNGRFISQLDPRLLQLSDNAYVTIGFDSSNNFVNFSQDWRLLTEEITEISRTAWLTKILRRLRGEILHLKTLLP